MAASETEGVLAAKSHSASWLSGEWGRLFSEGEGMETGVQDLIADSL